VNDPAGIRIDTPLGLVTAEDRFLKKLDIGPYPPAVLGLRGPCVIWTASTNRSGYGQFSVNRRMQLAHRVAYLLWVGDIEPGYHVHHRCHEITCCNPFHLEVKEEAEHVSAHNRRRSHSHAEVTEVYEEIRGEEVFTVRVLAPARPKRVSTGRFTLRSWV
jgi:hypothetical protein